MCILTYIFEIRFHLVGVFHTLYTFQSSDNYENILKEMRWNNAYIILGLEDLYVGNYNNKEKHISSVAMHVGMLDIHTLQPWTCQPLLHRYEPHVESRNFYMSQIDN